MPEKTKVILLADDDPEDQELLEETIIKLEPSVEIYMVGSGKHAVDYLQSCPLHELPCLIILDYSMPVFNAAEVLELIRYNPALQAIPKVVWSTSHQPEHVKPCLERGARTYFVKPNKMSELTEIAKQMLSICRS